MRAAPVFTICFVLALSSALAAQPLPSRVRAIVNAMNADCQTAGGKPGASPGMVSIVDVDGDGRDDHVIYTGAFECEGAESLFSGAGGGSVQVFLSAAGADAKPAFEHGAEGIRLEQRRLWLAVGGPLCGQKVTEDMPRSEMQACWRPLQWNAGRKTLDFGPLSSVRPYK
ncbi:hypothetical protein [Roseateles sp.]|uniref:hypothetical protein n=1 Tax=Roseateles sp. TaxID=1971397 RepID=UPI0039EAD54C